MSLSSTSTHGQTTGSKSMISGFKATQIQNLTVSLIPDNLGSGRCNRKQISTRSSTWHKQIQARP